MAIKIKNTDRKNVQDIAREKNLYIAENKGIIKTSPFFYEYFRLIIILQSLRKE